MQESTCIALYTKICNISAVGLQQNFKVQDIKVTDKTVTWYI